MHACPNLDARWMAKAVQLEAAQDITGGLFTRTGMGATGSSTRFASSLAEHGQVSIRRQQCSSLQYYIQEHASLLSMFTS